MNDLILRLKKTTFDIKRISETISLLDSVAQSEMDSLDNFTGAINLMSNLLSDSCKQLDEIYQEMHSITKNNQSSKGGDAAWRKKKGLMTSFVCCKTWKESEWKRPRPKNVQYIHQSRLDSLLLLCVRKTDAQVNCPKFGQRYYNYSLSIFICSVTQCNLMILEPYNAIVINLQ